MSITDVFPAEAGLMVTAVTFTPDVIGIAATPTGPTGVRPTCGTPSGRVHSRYTRKVADLPWQGGGSCYG
jgi:hypothetical protein